MIESDIVRIKCKGIRSHDLPGIAEVIGFTQTAGKTGNPDFFTPQSNIECDVVHIGTQLIIRLFYIIPVQTIVVRVSKSTAGLKTAEFGDGIKTRCHPNNIIRDRQS